MNNKTTSKEVIREIKGISKQKSTNKDAISKLLHRIRNKMININRVNFDESIDGRLQNEQHTLREDMKNYIKLHYELKEEMMDYFLEWL